MKAVAEGGADTRTAFTDGAALPSKTRPVGQSPSPSSLLSTLTPSPRDTAGCAVIDCGLRRISNLEPVGHSLVKMCLCDQVCTLWSTPVGASCCLFRVRGSRGRGGELL